MIMKQSNNVYLILIEFGGSVTTKALIDFVDAGGNVLVGANSQLSRIIVSFIFN